MVWWKWSGWLFAHLFFFFIERSCSIILHTDLVERSAGTSRCLFCLLQLSVITQSAVGTVWVLSSAGNPVHSGNSPDRQNPSPERESTNDWINYLVCIKWSRFKWSSRFYCSYWTEIMAWIEKICIFLWYFTYRNIIFLLWRTSCNSFSFFLIYFGVCSPTPYCIHFISSRHTNPFSQVELTCKLK